jgi:3-oxoacyl-[acyl-carrier protein] reductase
MSFPMLFHDLSGKVAVVVGGSGGIGRAVSLELAQAGAQVVVTYFSDDTAAEFVSVLPGGGHAAMPACVEDTASLRDLATFVRARYGRADILVNCAGFTSPVAAEDLDALDDDLIDRTFAVNWRGTFSAIRVFHAMLAEHGDGLIVNISSIAGQTGIGSNVAYCAAKAGIDVMTKALARSLAPEVRVMAISPGIVDTCFVPGLTHGFNQLVAKSIPLQRIATAQDVADAVLACATLLRYSTGSFVLTDGGRAL